MLFRLFSLFCCTLALGAAADIDLPAHASPRLRYAAERLQSNLNHGDDDALSRIVVRTRADSDLTEFLGDAARDLGRDLKSPESFVLLGLAGNCLAIVGADDSGALYGALETTQRLSQGERFPEGFRFADRPQFVVRGPCIGLQKTQYLPGRKVYEYPYTPGEFPFFYDRAYWTDYLDTLADLRMNTLYLWNGHPFASLVRLPDYPEAVEVSPETFACNVEMFRWLAAECDRRGIWLVQQFYSILISKPLAEKHGLSTQLHAWNDLAADYTRKSIAAFVREFPNVGLMPCLGEALQEQATQTRWMTEVILPGVKDGMAAAGLKTEPPVVLRTHATDATKVMPEALKVYHNLYTEAKFNGESLTTWEPRGVRQQLHLTMSRVGSTHIANVHILANLEPFRYGATEFIRKSVLAMRDRLGARGLHLYPLFYWDWPFSPDVASPPLKQWERDWIWFEAWARYAWNPDRDSAGERAYWIDRLATHYGNPAAAAHILDAYNDAGECAPRILRRFGITEGNRQTMSLGMTLDQLVNPAKYREFPELWESQSPPGERLREFAEREARGEPHTGETPPQIVQEIAAFSARAVAAIDAAAPLVTRRRAEFSRLRNDVHSIRAMSLSYGAKASAALAVLRYRHSHDIAHMQRAETLLADSLEHYRTLTRLAGDAYRAANSMQTSQRRIPLPGGHGREPANFHWRQLLPVYEQELADFRAQVNALKDPSAATRTHAPLPLVTFKLLTPGLETFTAQVGNTAFADSDATFTAVAPELEGLQGIKFSRAAVRDGKLPPIEIETTTPVRVLIGYFDDRAPEWRQPPTLETDASAAERGGAEPLLLDAARVEGLPPLNVHAFTYPAGRSTLEVRGTGTYLILGIVK